MKICLIKTTIAVESEALSKADSVQLGFIEKPSVTRVDDNLYDNDLFIADLRNIHGSFSHYLLAESSHINDRISSGGVLVCFADKPFHENENLTSYTWIPVLTGDHTPQPLTGQSIQVRGTSDYETVLSKYISDFEFKCVFAPSRNKNSLRFRPIAYDKAAHAVGLYMRHNHGHIFILPRPNNQERFISVFINEILPTLTINFSITSGSKEPMPVEIQKLDVVGQSKLRTEIEQQQTRVAEETKKLEVLNEQLAKLDEWKKLLCETDDVLRDAVKDFFEFLGLGLTLEQNYIDLTGDYNGKELFIEVKGRKGGINHKEDYRQIQERKDYSSKNPLNTLALLVGNPYRLNPLTERPPQGEMLFSKHSIPLAEANGIALVSTVELFKALNDVLNGSVDKQTVLDGILGCRGIYAYQLPTPPKA